jgi:hypothetical protein
MKKKLKNKTKLCVECGNKTITPRSSYCEKCFEKALKNKIREY